MEGHPLSAGGSKPRHHQSSPLSSIELGDIGSQQRPFWRGAGPIARIRSAAAARHFGAAADPPNPYYILADDNARGVLGESGEEFVVELAAELAEGVDGDGEVALAANENDFIAFFDIFEIGDVDEDHVHVDDADDAHALAVNEYAPLVAEGSGVAIGVSDGDGGDFHVGFCEVGCAIADEIA